MSTDTQHWTSLTNSAFGDDMHHFTVSMLPASFGDCIFVELEAENNEWYSILIDTGIPATWENGLKLLKRDLVNQRRSIDLLILTHIDSDHIGGAIPLLTEEAGQPFIREVWFNGLKQIIPPECCRATVDQNKVYRKITSEHIVTIFPPKEEIGVRDALSVEELIDIRGIVQNTCSCGRAIEAGLPTISITPNIKIDILLPTSVALRRLYQLFCTEIKKYDLKEKVAISPECERAFERVVLDELPEDAESSVYKQIPDTVNLDKWAKATDREDNSPRNRSSIAFCLRYYDHTMLFPGDATACDLMPALRKWSKEMNRPLRFDIIKLPHHGALRNNCTLFGEIDAKAFLISTDSQKYCHPSKETLARIVARQTDEGRLLIFNYENGIYKLFSNPDLEEKYNYHTILADWCKA